MREQEEGSKRVALLGNANTGKTTLFNKLCGLRQKTGNYPGVTVDKKVGKLKVKDVEIELIDLPGIKSLYPATKDEELVFDYLMKAGDKDFPELLVFVCSALNLKRNLYLLEQLKDLELPLICVVNMVDVAAKRGIAVDLKVLAKKLDIPVYGVSAKTGEGLEELQQAFRRETSRTMVGEHFIEEENLSILKKFAAINRSNNSYVNFLNLCQSIPSDYPDFEQQKQLFIEQEGIEPKLLRKNESILRYKHINGYIQKVVEVDKSNATDLTSRLDKYLVHPVWGYLIFLFILFFIFQSIFWMATYPMDWIDGGFAALSSWLSEAMPEGYFSDLISQGIVPGIGGVVIFVPQIAILFLLFSLLEESGYMSRIVYLTDRLMQRFGMSGKSVVPLISGMACAIPAIMSARTISNNKERLITIMVTPLMTCSARLPVYVILVALIVPDETYGIINAQGLALMGMYLLGTITALLAAFVFGKILKSKFRSYLMMELPQYLRPDLKNVLLSVWTSSKAFIWDAGKIILAASIILFVLATNGGNKFNSAESIVRDQQKELSTDELQTEVAAYKMEHSYLGLMGQVIEPVIKPLGYDWKIGIAVISSLAAREVFVGTMSTIYAIDSEEEMKIRDRLKTEVNESGKPVFGLATCISLLIFYAFSLQCLSTVAVTYKETGSIKWTSIQFLYMSLFAYFSALIAYQLLA